MGEITEEDVACIKAIFNGADRVVVQGEYDQKHGKAISVEYDNSMVSASISDFTEALEEGYVVDNVGKGYFQFVPYDVDVTMAHQND